MERCEVFMKKYLLVVVFVLMSGGFTLGSLFSSPREYSDLENRNLQQSPDISMHGLLEGEYQKQYENYLTDQFFFRDKWVGLHAQLECIAGKKEVNQVYLAEDGYLIEKYSEKDFDSELQNANVDSLSNFLNVTSDVLGKSHVSCLFVPSKIDALKDKVTLFEEDYNGNTVVEQVKDKVKNKERVSNLNNVLSKRSDEYIYYRTDHHWTTLGAYYAFCEYEKMNAKSIPNLRDYKVEMVYDDFLGTTYNKAHISAKPDEVHILHMDEENVTVNINNGEMKSDSFYFPKAAKEGFDRYRLFFSKNTGKIEVSTSTSNNKTLLLLKDSYANCFVPFLSKEFSKIIMIDCRYTKGKMKHIFQQYPDITDVLVLYNIEKFRKDTHLTSLELTEKELRQAKFSKMQSKKEDDSEDDILKDLVSLD